MSWLITIIVGAIIGILYGWAMSRRISMWHSIITGIIGAITGYWFFVDVLRFGTMNTSIGFFQGMTLIWEIIGSFVVLAIMSAIVVSEETEMQDRVERERRSFGPGVAHEYREERYEKRRDDEKRRR